MTSRIEEAIRTIRVNDRGGYTVPTNRLYPYQWNWDSGFTALGIWHFNKWRAWLEIMALLDAQWDDGMVPHIVFRQHDPDYFPGPGVWQTNTEPSTSGHSQPPVLASVILRMVRMGTAYDSRKAREVFPRLMAYHRWFCNARDPQGTGVIGIIHPWESGRDNCPDWDIGMEGITVPENLMSYHRRDTSHVDSDQRPTQSQYDRFITIVQFGREVGWDHHAIHARGPFLMADPGVQFILLRACRDLLELARLLDMDQALAEIREWIDRLTTGCDWLWNDTIGGYCARDIRTGIFSNAITNASMLSFYAGAGSAEQRASMAAHCRRILDACRYGMPSWDPEHADFESKRYWRGPVWAIMNHMVWTGLADAGEAELSARISNDTLGLVESQGMAEYFDPLDGTGLGGMDFSWTAAIYLDLCREEVAALHKETA
jgi:alpha,alpha-trehalase